MKKLFLLKLGVFAVGSMLLAGALHKTLAGSYTKPERMGGTADIVDTAVKAGSFNTLVSLVKEAGLEKALRDKGPYTVFAPTDEAFSKVPKDTLEALKKDKEKLKNVLLYHVVSGEVPSSQVKDGLKVKTLQGQEVNFSVKGGKPMINDANIIKTDVKASNGVIHVIDKVILPK